MIQKIISVVNQKGGVGKTTTAINLAAQLANDGSNVLLLDLDPQGNATSGIGVDKSSGATIYDALIGRLDVASIVRETHVAKLYVLPANSNLAGAEVEIVNTPRREFILSALLKSLGSYDYIIIDCPPSLGLLTVNALTASSCVIIPVQAEYYALEGLSQLLDTIQAIRNSTNTQLELLGLVVTMFDKRNSLSEQVQKEIQNYFGDKCFKTIIPRNVRLAEAPSYGRTIFEHDRWSRGARSYKALAKEVKQRTS